MSSESRASGLTAMIVGRPTNIRSAYRYNEAGSCIGEFRMRVGGYAQSFWHVSSLSAHGQPSDRHTVSWHSPSPQRSSHNGFSPSSGSFGVSTKIEPFGLWHCGGTVSMTGYPAAMQSAYDLISTGWLGVCVSEPSSEDPEQALAAQMTEKIKMRCKTRSAAQNGVGRLWYSMWFRV